MKNFRDLQVWQKAPKLTLAAYRATALLPKSEMFGLTGQIRRCSASVAANIAEGCGRRGNAEFHRFLQIAAGSASELEYHFLLAHDLGFFNASHYEFPHGGVCEVKKCSQVCFARLTPSAQLLDD